LPIEGLVKTAPRERNRRSRCVEKRPKCGIFGDLECLRAFLGGVSVTLGTGRVEIEALILVLLTVLRAGVTIMELNDESRDTTP